jgi:hypothetical protein
MSPSASAQDPFASYRRVGLVMALLIAAMACVDWIGNLPDPSPRDFLSFWGAGQFVLNDQPALAYDNQALRALQQQVVTLAGKAELPFPYPPFFLLLVTPFGMLPFPVGLILWSLAGYAMYLFAAHRLHRGRMWVAAAFPPVFANAALGQSGFVLAAIFLGGLALLPTRPRLAGLLLGCLILKPQMALMLPIAMLASRNWQVVAYAALSSASVMAAGFFLFGPAVTSAWLDQLPLYATIARDGLVGWHKFVSIYAAARQLGVPETVAFALHGAVALVAAVAVWRIWISTGDWSIRFAVLAAATMLASPYLYVYDALILIPAFVHLVERRTSSVWIGLAWLLPIATIVQMTSGVWPINVGPLSALIVLTLVWRTRQPDMIGN